MFDNEHYEVIARAIKSTYHYSINKFDAVGSHIGHMFLHDLVTMFMSYNPKFDKLKFMQLIDKEEK